MYFPYHSHPLSSWFLVVLDINRRTLMLYDSIKGKASHDNEVKKTIEPMVQFLLHVVDVLGGDKEFRREMPYLPSKFVMNVLNKVMGKYKIDLTL